MANGNMKRLVISLFAMLAMCSAWAGVEDDALAAYQRKDYATVLKIVRPPAQKGEAWAQALLGDAYNFGRGVVQDHAEAVKWYRLAAPQGDAITQYNLGVMYDNGHGVPQDFKEAARWYKLAAAQGNASNNTRRKPQSSMAA